MRRLFIIRHGNTFASSAEACRIGSRTDIPLVESGHAQAERLGTWFAQQPRPIRHLLSSPLLRARQTAAAITDATGHDLDGTIQLGLQLGNLGAQALADWEERGIAPDGWIVDAESRIAAWRAFFAQAGEGANLLVTSNGAARFALLALGLPPRKLRTGAFGELAVAPDGAVTLVRWDERP